jgi:uncharacterized protein (DUF885 family)
MSAGGEAGREGAAPRTDAVRGGPARGPNASFDALADAFWDAYLDAQPQAATLLGERGHDDRLPDHTPDGLRRQRARYAAIREALDRIGGTAGTTGDPIAASTLRDALDEQLAGLDSALVAWNVDTLDGIPVQLLNMADYQPVTSAADRSNLVARWREIGPHVDAHAANLRRSLDDGRIACSAPVDRVIDILDGVLAQPDGAWPLMAPAREVASLGLSTAERERFAGEVEAAIRDAVRPSFVRLRETLATVIRPAARPPDRPGLLHVPGGEAAYRRLARTYTTLDLAPEELHRIGLAEIERIDAETEALARRVLGTPDRRTAVAALRANPALHFQTRDDVFAKAASSLARAVEAIPDWFGRLPATPCEVVAMAAHEEEHSTIAYYREPPADGSRPGRYYINTAHPATRPRYEAEALAYHESVPGHHLQIAINQELPGLPAYRRHLGPTAFVEGWGLYVERLADEMGLYTGDLDRIGVLSFDAWRASRLVVDTGMHALGWTRQQAIDYMLEHTVLAPNNVVNEVDRYIVMPGQALAYKSGQLELLRLRAGARDRLGDRFDIRAFHDTVLGSGAVALATLRELVDAWVARTLATG